MSQVPPTPAVSGNSNPPAPQFSGGSSAIQEVVKGLPPGYAEMLKGVDLGQLERDQVNLKFKGTSPRTRASRQPISFVPAQTSSLEKRGRTDPYFIAAGEPEAGGGGGDDGGGGEG